MNNQTANLSRTIIRIGQQSLLFGRDGKFVPYTVKSGMSMAANLREAFRECDILSGYHDRAMVLTDTPTLLIPMEEYDRSTEDEMYRFTFPGRQHEATLSYVIPELNCVAVFGINKDVRMVIGDNFSDVRIMPMMASVWTHLHQTSYAGQTQKLYAYFQEKRLHIFAFGKNRLRFSNSFTSMEVMDSTYYIMYVWQQLSLNHRKDELFVVGNTSKDDALRTELRKYLQNVYDIHPSSEFNRAPITQVPNMPYDIICLCES